MCESSEIISNNQLIIFSFDVNWPQVIEKPFDLYYISQTTKGGGGDRLFTSCTFTVPSYVHI